MTFLPLAPGQHIVLLDASGFIYRAYHAMPSLVRRSDHHPIGALMGYCSVLWHLQKALMQSQHAPTHVVVVLDGGGQNFRHRLYPQYKANRPSPTAELLRQHGPIRQATDAIGIARVELPGHEADDIIATYVTRASKIGARVTIVSQDKDLRQLVGGSTTMYDPKNRQHIGTEEIRALMGVLPSQVADLLALMGDTTDNVPGVPGIGAKIAAVLVNLHGNVESIIDAARAGKLERRQQFAVLNNEDTLRLSRKLVELDRKVPNLPSLAGFAQRTDVERFVAFLREYDLYQLAGRVMEASA